MEQELIENFELLQMQDDEWDELHKKIMDERTQKNLTITDFLVSCGLDPDLSYFKQLCCRTTRKLHPSKRRNSPGREFRDAVANYFAGHAAASSFSLQSSETIIEEWCLDNRPRLRENKISDIRLLNPSSTDLIVYVYAGCTLSDDDIMTMLKADSKIASSLRPDSRIASRYESQLLALASPVCVKVGGSLGTASLVNVKGRIVALTCAHVLSEGVFFGKKVSFCKKDILCNKFKLDAAGSLFGYGFSNDDMDFAGILPSCHLPLLVNEIEEIGVPVKLTRWWKEPLISKLEYLTKTTVMKCGISSRTTTGQVVDVGANYFFVKGNEVTPFSVPGDSGSLVFNNDGEILGIVTEIAQFKQHGTAYVTKVLPVWEFYGWICDLSNFGVE